MSRLSSSRDTLRVLQRLMPLGARAAGTSAVEDACGLLCGALREAGIVDVSTQPFCCSCMNPMSRGSRSMGFLRRRGGACIPSRRQRPVLRGGTSSSESIGFSQVCSSRRSSRILDERGLEVARAIRNPVEDGGAGAFAASAGPTLTGPAAYVSNADSSEAPRTADWRDRSARLRRGAPAWGAQRNILGVLPGDDPRRSSSRPLRLCLGVTRCDRQCDRC